MNGRERGELVRELAATDHIGPGGERFGVAADLDRWIRAFRSGSFEALIPAPRLATPRTPPELLDWST